MNRTSEYLKEDQLNAISHALGALFSLVGIFILVSKNTTKSPYAIFSIGVYGFTLLLMFLISALYHHASDVVWKSRWRIMDHICIYLLIAGTYTPLALITLERDNGWTIFYTVWGLAGLDTVLKLFYTGKYETISLSLYVAMGWLIVLDFENVLSYTSARGLGLLFAGGIFYTVGILFYAVDRIPYNHFIWHLFVLAGAVSHWFFIYLDIV